MVGVKSPMAGVVYKSQAQLQSYVDGGVLGDRTLIGELRGALAKHAERIALSDANGVMTYAELDEQSDRLALAFSRLGLNPLDRVLYQLPNSREVIISVLACWKANLIPVCTLDAHRETEISYLGQHSGAVAHLIRTDKSDFDFAAFARRLRSEHLPDMEHIIVARGDVPDDLTDMTAMIEAVDPVEARAFVEAVEFDPYQVCVFQLSGGTTSVPKIIPQMSNAYLHAMEAVSERLEFREDDVFFVPLQMIHNAAMICYLFPSLLAGSEFAIAGSLEPAEIFRVMTTRKPTWFGLAGGALGRISAINPKAVFDLDRVRGVFSTNAASQIEEMLDVKGFHIFGMTEGMLMFASGDDPVEVRHKTLGRPVSAMDRVRIVHPGTEDDVTPGETGELLIDGPYTFAGYYKAPERDAEVFTSDGFARTGDLLSAEDIEGVRQYVFKGRLKDVVSRGGEKINCEEVEMVARTHPDIVDIAIVAMPDPEYDERACAFVIPYPGKSAPSVPELGAFLVECGMAKFKCPERVEEVAEFATTTAGKLSKPLLKEAIAEKLARETAGAVTV